MIVVDKDGGLTSHDVVARVRRLAGTRKVGHAGTLDPMATGVLLVGVNRATRLLGHLALTEKAYNATIRLGAATTTDDAEGDLVQVRSAAHLTDSEIFAAAGRFCGDIEQVPSSVSAIKVDGRRAYARVRDGEVLQLPARPVTIAALNVLHVERHDDLVDVAVSVHCSSGTYIRALARDIGELLDVGGHLTALRRTAVGPFTASESSTLEQLAADFSLMSMEEVAARTFPTLRVDADDARAVTSGRRLLLTLGRTGPVAVFGPTGEFLALYEQRGDEAAAVAVFAG